MDSRLGFFNGMARRKTTEEFIREAKLVHGDRYDYSLVEYKNYMTPVKIVCNKHGVFEKNLAHHLRGQGCPKCINRGKGVLEFIRQAKELYGDKYDYSLVNYKNNCSKVIIKCNKGHVFEKTPATFLLGYGCMECSALEKHNDFIRRAKLVHGDTYSYNLVKYTRFNDNVKIICKVHGLFHQTPKNHLAGKGCMLCGLDKTKESQTFTTKNFIEKAREIHGDRYIYDKSKYTLAVNKIKIECKIHGVFDQVAFHHLQGSGCIECARDALRDKVNGWGMSEWQKAGEKSKSFDSFKVYIIKCWNDNETFYKIGRTFLSIKRRFSGNRMPYNYEIIHEIIFDTAKQAFDKETELKRLNKDSKYVPLIGFRGQYECFDKQPII